MVLAGGTGEPLIGLEPTQLEGETAESEAARLEGETVIEVLAGGTGESLVGLESTPPEGETAYDLDSKTIGLKANQVWHVTHQRNHQAKLSLY